MVNRIALLILSVWMQCQPATADDSDIPPDGTYVCLTDRTVGIQEQDVGKVYEGAIKLPPELEKFFITIRKIKSADPRTWSYRDDDGWTIHSPNYCFSEEHLKELQDSWESAKRTRVELNFFWQRCLAIAQLRIGNGPSNFSSANGRYYTHDNMFDHTFMIFTGTLNFVYNYDIGGSYYVSTGRCAPVK
jgi:hypothetical protein